MNHRINGKWVSIPIFCSRRKKLYSHQKYIAQSSWYYFQQQSSKKNSYQKYLGMFLDSKLVLMNILKECLIKLANLLVLSASSKIFYWDHLFYKSINLLLRPHLDYGDVIYDQAFIGSVQNKLETIQYNAALALTGTTRETFRKKIILRKV